MLMLELDEINLLQEKADFDVFKYVTKKELEFFDKIDIEALSDLLKAQIGMEGIFMEPVLDFVLIFVRQQAIFSARKEVLG